MKADNNPAFYPPSPESSKFQLGDEGHAGIPRSSRERSGMASAGSAGSREETPPFKAERLHKEKAAAIRKRILSVSHRAKTQHIGSCLSLVEILTALYFGGNLNLPHAEDRGFEERDRVILSKGHGALALYATLTEKGILPEHLLEEYGRNGALLSGHLVYQPAYGLEAATGSLGHGLAIAVGIALAAKRDNKSYRPFVILSDGECDEGSTWEAVLGAGHWKLDNLIAIVDYNKIQSFGRVSEVMDLEPFADKWRVFGWAVSEVDGHDIGAINAALSAFPLEKNRPSVLIAHTVKGKGVSFMEDTIDWHYENLTDELLAQAIKEVDRSL